MKISVIANLRPKLGESPVWDCKSNRLFWLDCFGQKLYRSAEDGSELEFWKLHQITGSFALNGKDALLMAMHDGIYELHLKTRGFDLVEIPPGLTVEVVLNDGKVDKQGRFVFSSMVMSGDQSAGCLYSMNSKREIRVLESGINCGNGPCWSPDGSKMYFNDSAVGDIWEYDYSQVDGSVSNRKVLIERSGNGLVVPDGCTVDEEGYLWNARCPDGKIVRYTATGEIEREIELPVKGVTSVAFGGADMKTLFVTSIADFPFAGYDNEESPLRGSVFSITGLGIRGIPERHFAECV